MVSHTCLEINILQFGDCTVLLIHSLIFHTITHFLIQFLPLSKWPPTRCTNFINYFHVVLFWFCCDALDLTRTYLTKSVKLFMKAWANCQWIYMWSCRESMSNLPVAVSLKTMIFSSLAAIGLLLAPLRGVWSCNKGFIESVLCRYYLS